MDRNVSRKMSPIVTDVRPRVVDCFLVPETAKYGNVQQAKTSRIVRIVMSMLVKELRSSSLRIRMPGNDQIR